MLFVFLVSVFQELSDQTDLMMEHHWAPSTIETRNSQLKKYFRFCEIYRGYATPLPCSSRQICMFIRWMAINLKYHSILQYLSALNDFLKRSGATPIDYKDYNIHKAIDGCKRDLGAFVRQAKPLLPKNLLSMFNHLGRSSTHTAFRAAVLVSFRGLLRKAHVTDSTSMLNRQDFEFHTWGMIIKVKKSKTIQFSEREVMIPVHRLTSTDLCAVHWVEKHFREVGAAPGAKAFRVPGLVGSVPLQYPVYLHLLKGLCDKVGLPPRDFSSHSLRRGGATFLLMTGASIREIMIRGDWSSDTVYQYLATPLNQRIIEDLRVANVLSTIRLRIPA